jgi:hypothetical protein
MSYESRLNDPLCETKDGVPTEIKLIEYHQDKLDNYSTLYALESAVSMVQNGCFEFNDEDIPNDISDTITQQQMQVIFAYAERNVSSYLGYNGVKNIKWTLQLAFSSEPVSTQAFLKVSSEIIENLKAKYSYPSAVSAIHFFKNQENPSSAQCLKNAIEELGTLIQKWQNA